MYACFTTTIALGLKVDGAQAERVGWFPQPPKP